MSRGDAGGAVSLACALAGLGWWRGAGAGARLDDVAAKGEAVDNGRAEPWVGAGFGPAGEGLDAFGLAMAAALRAAGMTVKEWILALFDHPTDPPPQVPGPAA